MEPGSLRAARRRLGLSQRALAARLGVPKDTLNRWENGRQPLRHADLVALALRALEHEAAGPTARD